MEAAEALEAVKAAEIVDSPSARFAAVTNSKGVTVLTRRSAASIAQEKVEAVERLVLSLPGVLDAVIVRMTPTEEVGIVRISTNADLSAAGINEALVEAGEPPLSTIYVTEKPFERDAAGIVDRAALRRRIAEHRDEEWKARHFSTKALVGVVAVTSMASMAAGFIVGTSQDTEDTTAALTDVTPPKSLIAATPGTDAPAVLTTPTTAATVGSEPPAASPSTLPTTSPTQATLPKSSVPTVITTVVTKAATLPPLADGAPTTAAGPPRRSVLIDDERSLLVEPFAPNGIERLADTSPGRWVGGDFFCFGGQAFVGQVKAASELAVALAPLDERPSRTSVSFPKVYSGSGVIFRFRDLANFFFVEADLTQGRWDVWAVLDGRPRMVGATGRAPIKAGTTIEIIERADGFGIRIDRALETIFKDTRLNDAAGIGLSGRGARVNDMRWDDVHVYGPRHRTAPLLKHTPHRW